jgi:hypothetical protein
MVGASGLSIMGIQLTVRYDLAKAPSANHPGQAGYLRWEEPAKES